MGTYTTNYKLFMPSIGEQGWGELVNNNFSTIDTIMAGLNTRVGTLETEMDTVEDRVTVLETGNFETINVAGTIEGDTAKITELIVPYNSNGYKWAEGKGVEISQVKSTTWVSSATNLTLTGYPTWLHVDNAECTVTMTVVSEGNNNSHKMGVQLLDSSGAVIATYEPNMRYTARSYTVVVNPYDTYTLQARISNATFYVTASCTGLYLTA